MNKQRGVSLVELIVVLGIIAVMLAIFLPASFRVREAARETVCKNNLRQVNLGLLQQLNVGGIPPTNPESTVGGWAIELLPFLEEGNLDSYIESDISLTQLDPRFYGRPRVFECPTQLNNRPVSASSPEITPARFRIEVDSEEGPHYGGFYHVNAWQRGVEFRHAR